MTNPRGRTKARLEQEQTLAVALGLLALLHLSLKVSPSQSRMLFKGVPHPQSLAAVLFKENKHAWISSRSSCHQIHTFSKEATEENYITFILYTPDRG